MRKRQIGLAGAVVALSGFLTASAAWSQQAIVTHLDRIPNFGSSPTLTSVSNGAWSNPGTWSLHRVPAAGDIVQIAGGTTVLYDVDSSSVLGVVRVEAGATLHFRENVATQLVTVKLLILQGGALEVGTQAAPIAPQVSARIVLADQATDPSSDPEQFGTSLIALGRVTMHGAPKTPTFARLSREARSSDVSLDFPAPVAGWAVGDRIFLPDSRQLQWNERGSNYSPRWEYVTITSVSSDGRRIAVTPQLQFDHPGSRVLPSDSPEFLPHVANLSRNVVVKSANAHGNRGFVMFTERADVDIRYVAFGGLGRTTNQPFDNTTFDAHGNVTHMGSNERGRYPVTFRHLIGPQARPANGYQFTFIGNTIMCPLDPMPFRWGLALFDSHYGLVQDNVLNNWAGAGIVFENGSESYNVVEHNFVSRIKGTGERVDEHARAGTAYWFRGPNNTVRNNVATNAQGGVYTYGFSVFAYFLGSRLLPTTQGADPADQGQGVSTDMHSLPLRQFVGNEVYGATENGLTLWWIGVFYQSARDGVATSVVKDFRVWNFNRWGYFGYNTNKVTIDGFVARGSYAASAGLYYSDYLTQNHLAQHLDIQGIADGINLPVFVPGNGTVLVRDSFLDNQSNVVAETLNTNSYRADKIPPRTIELQNVRFGTRTPTISGRSPLDIEMRFGGPNGSNTRNWIQSDRMLVYGFNGVSNDNFAVYYLEQAPDFIVPATTYNSDGTPHYVGSPQSGLSNTENWRRYGLAIGAAVTPCKTQRPRIKGFTCSE